jgi:hypothetical protein
MIKYLIISSDCCGNVVPKLYSNQSEKLSELKSADPAEISNIVVDTLAKDDLLVVDFRGERIFRNSIFELGSHFEAQLAKSISIAISMAY